MVKMKEVSTDDNRAVASKYQLCRIKCFLERTEEICANVEKDLQILKSEFVEASIKDELLIDLVDMLTEATNCTIGEIHLCIKFPLEGQKYSAASRLSACYKRLLDLLNDVMSYIMSSNSISLKVCAA